MDRAPSILLPPLASQEQYETTPSSKDDIPWVLEAELRVYGARLIQEAAMALHQSQRAAAIGQILFQRFWFVSSMRSFNVVEISQAAVLLGAKLDEAPLRMRDLVNVFDFLVRRDTYSGDTNPGPRQRHLSSLRERNARKSLSRASDEPKLRRTRSDGRLSHDPPKPFEWSPPRYQEGTYLAQKCEVVVAEMQLLMRLAFRTEVTLPYNTLANYLQLLGLTDAQRFPGAAQRAWSIVNDALQTPVYCLFRAHAIACAAIYLTTLCPPPGCPAPPDGQSMGDHQLEQANQSSDSPSAKASFTNKEKLRRQICLPYEPAPWFELLDVDEGELRVICAHLLELYDSNSPPVPPQPIAPKARPTPRPRGVVGHYASDTDSDSPEARDSSPKAVKENETTGLDAWAQMAVGAGLSARVKDAWGGMVAFARDRHVVVEYADLLKSIDQGGTVVVASGSHV